ncbi:uncharacterized protein LOC142355376, partial [Convolutriloba macropyga]|uniref:uncharacterized protein LOC142355376 n=1 Tax=Convolutriloba macropyga TaxID=536237 RepID=UPI003F52104E
MDALIGSNRDNSGGCLGNSGSKRWIWVRNLDDSSSQKGSSDLKGKEPALDRFMDSPERKLLVRNTSVKSMRKNFELFEIKTNISSNDSNVQLRNPFEKVEKCSRRKECDEDEFEGREKHEKDSKEKEDVGRKRRQRLVEFLLSQEERSPAAKRAKTGTVYHTIRHFALSQD